jgi:Histidine phosphatase superfamily (branch 1)
MTDVAVYLVRHGETAHNADGRLRGLAVPDLNAQSASTGGAHGVDHRPTQRNRTPRRCRLQ